MAIRCELGADRERGPGHGLLRITGLGSADGPIDFVLRCNHPTRPYLGPGGVWQATEAWHAAPEVYEDGGALVIRLGPTVIDAIVAQPTTITYRLAVAFGATRTEGGLKVQLPLLGSGAAAAPAPPPPPPAAVAEAAPVPAVPVAPPPAEAVVAPAAPSAPARRRWPLVAALAALVVLAGAGAAAWYACLIPGFAAGRCQQRAAEPLIAAPATPVAEPVAPVTPAAEPASCAELDAAACLALARAAAGRGELETARQLFQQASALGAVEADQTLGRMYDPETWSRETSPAAEPSWETAVYWYEKAARQGTVEAQLAAGRLLCAHAVTAFERNQGLGYLRQAQQAGNAAAVSLIAACEAQAR